MRINKTFPPLVCVALFNRIEVFYIALIKIRWRGNKRTSNKTMQVLNSIKIKKTRKSNIKLETRYLHARASTSGCTFLVVAGTTSARLSARLGVLTIIHSSPAVAIVPETIPIRIAHGIAIIPVFIAKKDLIPVVRFGSSFFREKQK